MDQNELNKIRQDTDIAIKQGWDNTKIEWRKQALMVIYSLCTKEATISANDFTEIIKDLPVQTHDNRSIGGLVKMAEKFRWVTKTGEVEVSRAGHLSRIQIWRSLLFGKVEDEDPFPQMDWHRASRTYVDLGNGNFIVNGTRGKQYRVFYSGDRQSCECDAYKYSPKEKKTCRHIRMIAAIRDKKEEIEIEKSQKNLFQKVGN